MAGSETDVTDFVFETPTALAQRLKLGREEFAQRLLTSLILEAPYPRWNTEHVPSQRGVEFLQRLHGLSFPPSVPFNLDDLRFIDEFELPPDSDAAKGGSPDYCVRTPTSLWMIELKTEAGSHRADQIPMYYRLARHHHRDSAIALTYLTPSLPFAFEAPFGLYGHVEWSQIVPVIRAVWDKPGLPGQRDVVEGLCDLLNGLDRPTAEWRDAFRNEDPSAARSAGVGRGLELASATAEDGTQRALDFEPASLEELHELRLELRHAITDTPTGSKVRNARPWVWTEASGGAPLTDAGRRLGAELRLSRYRDPL